MRKYIEDFSNYILIQKNYSERTVAAYRYDLTTFFNYLNEVSITTSVKNIKEQNIFDFLAYLASSTKNKSPISVTTRARKLSSIRSYFSFLKRKEIIENNPAENIDLPKLPIKEPSYLNEDEYKRLIDTIEKTATPFFKLRDLAVVSLFVGTGIRVSELVGLKTDDIDLENKLIKVKRKRNKEQTIPFNKNVKNRLFAYLEVRPKAKEQNLFLSKRKRGLRQNSIYSIVKKYLQKSQIKKNKQGPHVLRHTCFTMLMRKNIHPVVIQHLAGHSSFDTTRRYLHLDDKQVREAVNKLDL